MMYKLVTATANSATLNDDVNDLLAEGWKLYGDHNVIRGPDCITLFSQAMIFDDKEEPQANRSNP